MRTAIFVQDEPRGTGEWQGPAKRFHLIEPYIVTDPKAGTREVYEVVVALHLHENNPYHYNEVSIYEVVPGVGVNDLELRSFGGATSIESALNEFGYKI